MEPISFTIKKLNNIYRSPPLWPQLATSHVMVNLKYEEKFSRKIH